MKEIIYTTMEILPGRTLSNNLMNLPGAKEFEYAMKAFGLSFGALEDLEREPALGNGGLGRLGACLVESAATKEVPMKVNVLRFRNGFFRQEIENGWQKETSDLWQDENGNYLFESKVDEKQQKVYFNENGKTVTVTMVPYDITVIGYGGYCNYIRTWGVEKVEGPVGEEVLKLYRKLDDRLYPDDSTAYGKKLRLAQEYALSAATVGCVFDEMKENNWKMNTLFEHFCIHMNDTHSVLMVPECVRRLRKEHGFSFEKAWEIVGQTFVYTNHTILAEALEHWAISLVEALVPSVYRIIDEIHHFVCGKLKKHFAPSIYEEKLKKMAILYDGEVHMARLAIFASKTVNGVAKIHTQILCERELKEFYEYMPDKFVNITNGVTQRKFVYHANPELSEYLTDYIGNDEWVKDFTKVRALDQYAEGRLAQMRFLRVKRANKERLAKFVWEQKKIHLPVDMIFDVHVKRFHEYKRQQLNCLKILALYRKLKYDPNFTMEPTAFIFAGKAAPAYTQAKRVISLIHYLEKLVNNDPAVCDKMKVVFIEDFNVTKSEMIYAAADISEQISTASKEASGTGNMKFMMNGALTLGTLDGANVEILEAVGPENMFLFGMTAEEVMDLEKHPEKYNPWDVLKEERGLFHILESIHYDYPELVDEWTRGQNGNPPDRFFVLKDFASYLEAFLKANEAYKDKNHWAEMCIRNIAGSGNFSSDRTVDDYCEKVWKCNK